MSVRKRAMQSAHASAVKTGGHKNEQDFASLVGGRVMTGNHTDKRDVSDGLSRPHSVKGGEWWQIFLYGRERLATNTILVAIGNIAPILVDCLDVYPANRDDYLKDKLRIKTALQTPMRKLANELKRPNIFPAFLLKSIFDGGNADFLSVYLGSASDHLSSKIFHIFHSSDVVSALAQELDIQNSKAMNKNQMDAQKVIFKSSITNTNVGEIEVRHDSKLHYKQLKFRLNASGIMKILQTTIKPCLEVDAQLVAYGNGAIKHISKLKSTITA